MGGPLPSLQDMLGQNRGMGVMQALQKIEQIKQLRVFAVQAAGQAQQLLVNTLAAARLAAASPITLADSTKPARQLYVGNLPVGVLGPQLAEFLSAAMQQMQLTMGPGSPVVGIWMSPDGRFALVDFRSLDEANKALALDKLPVGGGTMQLRVGRPTEYREFYETLVCHLGAGAGEGRVGCEALNCSLTRVSAAHHSLHPTSQLKMTEANALAVTVQHAVGASSAASAASLGAGTTPGSLSATSLAGGGVVGAPAAQTALAAASSSAQSQGQFLMLANVPGILGEVDVRALLEPFGQLKSFNMLKDKEGMSKGIAIFEYEDKAQAGLALKGLAGLDLGGKRLSIQEIPAHQASMLLRPVATASGSTGASEEEGGSVVIRLQNMLADDTDAEEVEEIKEEVMDECRKYGNVVSVHMDPAQGFIFVEFGSARASKRAQTRLDGRSFDGRTIRCRYYPLEAYLRRDLHADPLEEDTAPAEASVGETAGGNGTTETGGAEDGVMSLSLGKKEEEGAEGAREEGKEDPPEEPLPVAVPQAVEEDLD